MHKKGSTILAEIDYTATARDKTGNPKSMTDWTGTWDYVYDKNNRLVGATPPNPVPDQPAGGNYGYDWVGNRLNPPTGTNHMVYNAADQLTRWPGMYSYSYWEDGSLKEVKGDTNGALISSYTYHSNGLLYQAVYAGGKTAVNTWDDYGNRVGLEINEETYSFVYDATAGIPAVIEENKAGGTPVYYYREPDGALIARYDSTNGLRYYHFDELGSTRLITDGRTGEHLGNPTDKYSYDAWGTVAAHDRYDGSIDQPYQYVGKLGYYTHYQDPDFKLLQLGVRFYDTETGRFTQRDPAEDGLNWYEYVRNNPNINTDPTGRECYRCWRELETFGGLGGQWHAFIWCDEGNNGYDSKDPLIGFFGDSMCDDRDRKYLSNKALGDSYGLKCNKLSSRLTTCIINRIKKDQGKKCFGKYSWCRNNCQHYAQDIIDKCK